MAQISTCPQCGVRVVPKSSGDCPSCGHRFFPANTEPHSESTIGPTANLPPRSQTPLSSVPDNIAEAVTSSQASGQRAKNPLGWVLVAAWCVLIYFGGWNSWGRVMAALGVPLSLGAFVLTVPLLWKSNDEIRKSAAWIGVSQPLVARIVILCASFALISWGLFATAYALFGGRGIDRIMQVFQ